MKLTDDQLDLWGKKLMHKIDTSDIPEMRDSYKQVLEGAVGRTARNEDSVFAVTGWRGKGKTGFSICSSLLLRQMYPSSPPAFTWDNICYDSSTLGDMVEKAASDNTKIYIIDESIDVAYGRDAMAKINRELAKFMTKARKLKNIYFWNIPEFASLDSELRNRIVHYWVDIFYKTKNSDRDANYAFAAMFRKDMNSFTSDKWGFDEAARIIKHGIHNPAEYMRNVRRIRSFVTFLAFPILPKVVEDAYLETSMASLQSSGKQFAENLKASFIGEKQKRDRVMAKHIKRQAEIAAEATGAE